MSNDSDRQNAGTPHKKDQLAKLADELLGPPEADHVMGRCQECQEVVWIDTGLRPAGMARSCEEHEPLCRFRGDDCD